MNRDETWTLWQEGQEAWNAWARERLEERTALEQAGLWAENWFGEGENDETRAWLALTAADFSQRVFGGEAAFDGLVFAGPADFEQAVFQGKASFAGARFAGSARFASARFDGDVSFAAGEFHGMASFDDAHFAGVADFDKAQFLKETTGPLVPAMRFQRTLFAGKADFRGATVKGNAEFMKARFAANARFDEAAFAAGAAFDEATFADTASFNKAQFAGEAKLNGVRFAGEARFGETQFLDLAQFEDVRFHEQSSFREVGFFGPCHFHRARFGGEARFVDALFGAAAQFTEARFQDGSFERAQFKDVVRFDGVHFSGDAGFDAAIFTDDADFHLARFKGVASMQNARFLNGADFRLARFSGPARFDDARFAGIGDFTAMRAAMAFVLRQARFAQVPNFLDTTFHESPRLDDMTIVPPTRRWQRWRRLGHRDPRPLALFAMKVCAGPDCSAKFRRLKKLAWQAQDPDSARDFHALELCCRRFWQDRPFGCGWAKFWLGWLYGSLSDFGRSLRRPLLAWLASVFAFALFYLGQRGGDGEPALAATPLFPDFPVKLNLLSTVLWLWDGLAWSVGAVVGMLSGGSCLYGSSRPAGEALYLSFKNALVVLQWDSVDAPRRVYGCLYGLEGALPKVPLAVAMAGMLQMVLSAVLIFLFLMALRNLLKLK